MKKIINNTNRFTLNNIIKIFLVSVVLVFIGCDNINNDSSSYLTITFDNIPNITCGSSWEESDVKITLEFGPGSNCVFDTGLSDSVEPGEIGLWPAALSFDFNNLGINISKVEIDLYDYCPGCTYAELLAGVNTVLTVQTEKPYNSELQTITLSTDKSGITGARFISSEAIVTEVRLYK